jgi:hypothetical protein
VDGGGAAVQNVGVNQFGGDILVTEELLDGWGVVAVLQQLGGEAISETVGA